ncbi:MAG: hypothetical protein Q9192_003187 [Flavoplaca navasiana]
MLPNSLYQYEALVKSDSIRLLQLEPAASNNTIIHCELIDVELATAPGYEALSYVWGNKDSPQSIYLPYGYLEVTENLASALRDLQYGGRSRLLWVDAVCIHQSDSTEKARQVALMARIYRSAFRVLAWLGGDDGNIINLPTILKFSQMAKQLGLKSPAPENKAVIQKWFYGDPEKVIWLEGAIRELGDANFPTIYDSAWFTRMWIVQEVRAFSDALRPNCTHVETSL